jgi:hypothetical protein
MTTGTRNQAETAISVIMPVDGCGMWWQCCSLAASNATFQAHDVRCDPDRRTRDQDITAIVDWMVGQPGRLCRADGRWSFQSEPFAPFEDFGKMTLLAARLIKIKAKEGGGWLDVPEN